VRFALLPRCLLSCALLAIFFSPSSLRAQNRPPFAAHHSSEPSGPEKELFDAANRERAAEDLPPLEWDPALAAAARKHALRMAEEKLLEHQYAGEASLRDRAAGAGAHFSLVAENIAVAQDVEAVHMGWMHSPGHRGNILDPHLNSIGIATVKARGYLFAAQDFSRVVETLTLDEQEQRVAALLTASGFKASIASADARKTCLTDSGNPGKPGVFYRFETADLSRLPENLAARIGSIHARNAAVGACPSKQANGFTRYRIAILFS
jgi:uncharacterized protein YkwD